jgi:hypothetical protein
MATSTPPLTIEQRLASLESAIPKLAGLAGSQVQGRLSTRAAGFLTALATGLTFVITSGFFTTAEAGIASAIVGGISAFLAAEET